MVRALDPVSRLLQHVVKNGASDLHIHALRDPFIRINGDLIKLDGVSISEHEVETWLATRVDKASLEEFKLTGDMDFSFDWENGQRFRANAYYERGNLSLALRYLKPSIPSMEDLGLPAVARNWPGRQTGLILVTGPTGSGKSTTVASMVNYANQNFTLHTLTVEDPVEFIIPKGIGIVDQREIGSDADDFPQAVRAGLRQDVDIMVIGEMRDLETISTAITVAETGHLVFATLHTSNAAQAIDRVIDAFDPNVQSLVRSRLSACLVGVIYQRLLKSKDGGRVAAYEILVATHGVKNLIREGKTHQIANMMTTGVNQGMQTMEMALTELVKKNVITPEEASQYLSKN